MGDVNTKVFFLPLPAKSAPLSPAFHTLSFTHIHISVHHQIRNPRIQSVTTLIVPLNYLLISTNVCIHL